jgi:hypothetical protein
VLVLREPVVIPLLVPRRRRVLLKPAGAGRPVVVVPDEARRPRALTEQIEHLLAACSPPPTRR